MLGLGLGVWVRFWERGLGLESLESFGQLVGQRDMRERRLLTHKLAVVCVPELGITN